MFITLPLTPGVTEQKVTLSVEDDDVFEEDEHFYIRIHNPRRKVSISQTLFLASALIYKLYTA